jgi:hypothetical protein
MFKNQITFSKNKKIVLVCAAIIVILVISVLAYFTVTSDYLGLLNSSAGTVDIEEVDPKATLSPDLNLQVAAQANAVKINWTDVYSKQKGFVRY